MKLAERRANITDLDFIYGCILYGARKGHYSFDADSLCLVKSMKKEIQSVVLKGTLADERLASASVFFVGLKRIGAMILCEATPGVSSCEIYAMSVTKQFQNKGYGSQMLNGALNRLSSVDVYARCSPVSEIMSNLLLRRGFRFFSIDNDHTILVRDAVCSSDFIEPIYKAY